MTAHMLAPMSSQLQAAVHSQGEARLEHLLAAWQDRRQPEVARSIAELGAALGSSLGADPHDLDAWHAQAGGAPARIRGELLDRLDKTNWKKALAQDVHLRNGLNVCEGKVTCEPVAEAHNLAYVTAESAIGL